MSDKTNWSITTQHIKGTISQETVYIARRMTPEGYWKKKEFPTYSAAKAWCENMSCSAER